MRVSELAVSLVRSRPITAAARRLTGGRLRILAYHGVPDSDRFARQMEYLAHAFTPVGEDAVISALGGGADLPEGAAWVTFDDGDPTVVNSGLDTLVRLGIPATMFICPGLIETGQPFWWRVTDWATAQRPELASAIAGAGDLTEFVKTIPDAERRVVVADLISELGGSFPSGWRQLSDAELDRWAGAGMGLGNHSWDHPCLDRCYPDDQRRQMQRTHDWLCHRLGRHPRTFAYPNGNFSPVIDAAIDELGYELAVLYDNRLTDLGAPRLQLSRLMLEADHPVERVVGVLSGAQPVLGALASRMRR